MRAGRAGSVAAVGWEPMTADEAQKILDDMPASGTTNAEGWARYIEAMLVSQGAEPERIKRRLRK